ncbi:MAG: hypothetical protein GY696_02630 [Gammaproteobacteria bacterium]|nr:hypothetical protein [Gammaproteobacteria bacterium]
MFFQGSAVVIAADPRPCGFGKYCAWIRCQFFELCKAAGSDYTAQQVTSDYSCGSQPLGGGWYSDHLSNFMMS